MHAIAADRTVASPWLAPHAVTGHYHEQAALAPVTIVAKGGRAVMTLLAKQAHFTCDLEFDRSGAPSVLDHCAIEKIDAFGRTQHDVVWWIAKPILFSCKQSARRQICRGAYELDWGYPGGQYGGEESRVMRLVRESRP
jgi:hypothetical protein